MELTLLGAVMKTTCFTYFYSLFFFWNSLFFSFQYRYGHEINIIIQGEKVTVCYVPFLSGLQVFSAASTADNTPLAEFSETTNPYFRMPFLDKIQQLGNDFSCLLEARTCQLDMAKSWFAVSWYPICNDHCTCNRCNRLSWFLF